MQAFHDGEGFRLHDDHGILLPSVGQRLMFVFSWAHCGSTGGVFSFDCQIARQLNYKRTLTSSTTARIDLAGFPYEAFEQGESKVQPWSVVLLLSSTMRYIAHPEEANSDQHQQKSFADLDRLAKAYNFYAIRLDVKINKYLYNENSPKYPLSVTVALDYVGKSSKRTIHRIFHQDDLETPYVECILTDVLVSQDTMKPAPYPDWWIEKYAPLCKRDKLPNLILPTVNEQTHCRTSTVVNLSDTDIYKHTHITSYIKYFYDSVYRNISNEGYKNISQNHFDSGVKSVSLEYTGQSIVHDELDITTWEIGNDNVVYGTIEKKGGTECCRIKMEFYNEKVQPML